MPCFLELTYVSPISNYSLNKTDTYIITFVGSSYNKQVPIINKAIISGMENVNDKLRGNVINRTINMTPDQYPRYKINIFRHHNKSVQLLFTGNIEVNDYEYNQKSNITLYAPLSLKSSYYKDDTTFLDEKFFNLDNVSKDNKCLLFFMKLDRPRTMVIVPDLVDITNSSNRPNIYIYDRYSGCIIQEYIPYFIREHLNTNNVGNIQYVHNVMFINDIYKKDDYKRYINLYNPDTTVFDNSFKKIKHVGKLEYRPLRYDSYGNNLIVAPCDSRIRTFNINSSVVFSLYNAKLKVTELVDDMSIMVDGGGFLCRMTPIDYQRVFMPYSGFLTDVKIYKPEGNRVEVPYCVILKFESNYYMPKDVSERNYMAVIYGNFMYGGRGVGMAMREAPELLEVQPNTKLTFYIVLVGSSYDESIKFTNLKLQNINNDFKTDWYEQGEELCIFKCCGGTVICLYNREVDCTADIKTYSTINDGKQMDTLIKARDILAELI